MSQQLPNPNQTIQEALALKVSTPNPPVTPETPNATPQTDSKQLQPSKLI